MQVLNALLSFCNVKMSECVTFLIMFLMYL